MMAEGKCKIAYELFKSEGMASNVHKKFHDCLPKLSLKTFSDLAKSKKTKAKSKEVVLKADYKLFGHMVLVAASRKEV